MAVLSKSCANRWWTVQLIGVFWSTNSNWTLYLIVTKRIIDEIILYVVHLIFSSIDNKIDGKKIVACLGHQNQSNRPTRNYFVSFRIKSFVGSSFSLYFCFVISHSLSLTVEWVRINWWDLDMSLKHSKILNTKRNRWFCMYMFDRVRSSNNEVNIYFIRTDSIDWNVLHFHVTLPIKRFNELHLCVLVLFFCFWFFCILPVCRFILFLYRLYFCYYECNKTPTL